MKALLAHLQAALAGIAPVRRLWVGYSGGLDSSVLLEVARQYAAHEGISLEALHVHHGLSPNADRWVEHCERQCRLSSIPLTIERVSVSCGGEGLEAAAREARYAVFARHVRAGDILLLAHHRDDLAETLLLRLMRGTGLQGLAGMPVARAVGQGLLLRPFLAVGRIELEQAARAAGVNWVDDESNDDVRFDRNFLRRQVMPLLRERWPEAPAALARCAGHAREAADVMDALASDDLAHCLRPDGGLALAGGPVLAPGRLNAMLRLWLGRAGVQVSASQLVRLHDEVWSARPDASPVLVLGAYSVRRYRDALYLLPELPAVAAVSIAVSGPLDGLVVAGGRFVVHERPGGLAPALFERKDLALRWRSGGEQVQLAGRPRRPLKKILQESALAPWWRERLPLLYAGDALVAIPGIGVCDGWQVPAGMAGLFPEWIPDPVGC